jgi:hypothetical protein
LFSLSASGRAFSVRALSLPQIADSILLLSSVYFSPSFLKSCLILRDDSHSTANLVMVKTVIVSNDNFPLEIYNQQIALMPNVNMHRFVVIGIYFEMKTTFS